MSSQGNQFERSLSILDDLNVPIAIRKNSRTCTKFALYPMSKYVPYKNLSSLFLSFTSQLSSVDVPKNMQEDLGVLEWRKVVFEEMEALEKNDTKENADLPRGKIPVGCKWVFIMKFNSEGSLEYYKA